jgi:membrane protein DedA with SNARE-associated domain
MFIIGALIPCANLIAPLVGLPPPTELAAMLSTWLASHGLWAVFAGYLLEAVFVLGFYVPGSFVLFTAALGANGPLQLLAIWAVANVAAALGLTLNYLLGRFGLSRLLLRLWDTDQYERFGRRAAGLGTAGFFVIGFHINWLSLLTTFHAATTGRGLGWTLAWAMTAHSLWSLAVLFIVHRLGGAALARPDAPYWIAALFFAIGSAACVLEAARRR